MVKHEHGDLKDTPQEQNCERLVGWGLTVSEHTGFHIHFLSLLKICFNVLTCCFLQGLEPESSCGEGCVLLLFLF